ncbi:MAG: hypothetical protein WC455_12305 [Dehalococcoidia bacterium]|jgi:hypothetical protein
MEPIVEYWPTCACWVRAKNKYGYHFRRNHRKTDGAIRERWNVHTTEACPYCEQGASIHTVNFDGKEVTQYAGY